MWALLALMSAAGFGVVSAVDKRVLTRHLPGVSELVLWGALTIAVYVPAALAVTGLPPGATWELLAAALGSGLSLGAGLALTFAGLRREDAARALAVVQIYPVFVALLAVALLGERLSVLQWAAMSLVVMGAILVSLKGAPSLAGLLPRGGTPYLVLAGFFTALAYLLAKLALAGLPVWHTFAVQQLGVMAVFLLFARPKVWRRLGAALRRRNTLLLLLLGEGVIPIACAVLGITATSLGPVSLVTAVLATRPLFVFVVSMALRPTPWNITDEPVTRLGMALKAVSIGMIVLGVAALALL